MRTIVMSHRGRFQNGHSLEPLAAALHDPHNIIWLDIQDATEEDVVLLREQFGFHPLAIEDAIRAHERPKVDAYGIPGDIDGDGVADTTAESDWSSSVAAVDGSTALPDTGLDMLDATASNPELEGWTEEEPEESVLIPLDASPAVVPSEDEGLVERGYYFIVFYAAIFDSQEDHIRGNPISLFIGANYLVTVHAGPIPHIGETMARWRAPKSPLGHRVGILVHSLLDAMVDDYFPLMDQVADRVEELEDSIFTHFDESSIETIFRLKKDLLGMRRIVSPERDVLNVLLRRQLPVFSAEDVAYLQDVYDHIVRVTDSLDTYRDLVSSALDSYLSLQGNRLNQIMKVLTVASIILMADALITGFYGQNFKFFPGLDFRIGSFWSIFLIVATTLALWLYFRRKKWL
jgi:magnesium transporter